MQNRWALSGCASAVQPSSSTSGDSLLPPPFPSDPRPFLPSFPSPLPTPSLLSSSFSF
ncbi:BnaA09g54500D [Brassica napus]|uniref:(rape) hypothetical protein n=1 Tax=Brassica napus TaxID=3708 RepID=A0A078JSC2_BRANA|nr:unnamed protein product [Brassica napus]CDY68546.1 BnaA09g54500D [Brassica napus]